MAERTSPFATMNTFLMKGTTGSGSTVTWAKLVDIKDFPDLGGDPATIEVTTLSDTMQTFCEGVMSSQALKFTANYNKTSITTINAISGTTDFAVWFGGTSTTPTGDDGKWQFKGTIKAYPKGGGVGDPTEMQIVITPSTAITMGS